MESKPCGKNCHAPVNEDIPFNEQVSNFFTGLFSTDNWPDRWHCGKWSDLEGWIYIASDILIWGAYFTIPFILIRFIIRKKDVPFPKVFWLFGAFIIACGTNHLLDAVTFWWPAYRLNALTRVITAITSWGTIIALTKVLPDAFSLKTPAELERVVKERTDQLEKSIEYSRFLANLIPQMVWTSLPDGNANYFSDQWKRYTGYNEADLLNRGWEIVIHPEDLQRSLKEWEKALNDISSFEIAHRIRSSGGVYRWHLTRAVPQTDKEGNILLWIGTTTDIEDQKEIEKQKDQFMGVASHELKTPLTAVKAYLQLMNKEIKNVPANEKFTKFLEQVNIHTSRIEQLIADLLDVSRLQAGKMIIDHAPVDLCELLTNSVNTMQLTTNHQKLSLKCDDELFIVNADKIRIEQVIYNFLSNAIKYSPGANKVDVRLEKRENNAVVSVTDYGIGISEENKEKVFQRFYRIAPTSTKFAGLGIGLFISKEIILQHGGSIWVESEANKGSTFSFSLPLLEE